MTNRLPPPSPEDSGEFHATAIRIKVPKNFDQTDPVACRKVADGLKESILQQMISEGIPEEVAPQLATQVADSFYNSLVNDGPCQGVATATCELSEGDLLRSLIKAQGVKFEGLN